LFYEGVGGTNRVLTFDAFHRCQRLCLIFICRG